MKDKTYKRHLAKTVTWRIVGTLDTIILAWLISGDPIIGLQIGAAEVVTKMILYYLHERVWFRVKIGVKKNGQDSRNRHIAKTFSWRAVGTLDTMLLAWIISGNPMTGFKIGIAEVVTKMLLYYLHERTWYRIDFGLTDRSNKEERKEMREDERKKRVESRE